MPVDTQNPAPDAALAHPLDTLRGGIKKFVLWDGILLAALFLVLWFWIGLALDWGLFKLTGFDWVPDAPKGFRVAGLLLASGGLAALVASRLYRRLTKTFSYPALALVLEKRFPHVLGDRLITAVELADTKAQVKYGYSEAMIRQSIAEAREKVKDVPVGTVFNWPRLKKNSGLLVALGLGLLVLVFGGYALATQTFAPAAFGSKFTAVSATWAERNILLQDTPWPRRAHLELVSFEVDKKAFDFTHDDRPEVRIGKDSPAPKVKVRAFQWVIADAKAKAGWRPLVWGDLTQNLLGIGRPPAPAGVTDATDLDAIGAGSAAAELKPVFDKLDEMASVPAPRQVRKLAIPEAVTVRYAGKSTRGDQSLTREANNVFAGDLAGLQESVRFYAKGDDFTTPPKLLTLVPPPMLTRLTRSDSRPAYLYHPAPTDPALGDTPEKRFAGLKGLKQVFAEKDVTLTGEKSIVPSVLIGTEVVLRGTADKPLKQVAVFPKTGRIPGLAKDAPGPLLLRPTGDNGDGFSLAFQGEFAIRQTTEFDLELTDRDDVTSRRTIVFQATEDQPPLVELAVDVLRRQGTTYLVTPMVRVPFVPDSFVRDDRGLSKVEYVFSYSQVEAKEVQALQAKLVATAFASAPGLVGLPAAIGSGCTAALASIVSKVEQKSAGALTVYRFADKYDGLPKATLDLLKRQLTQPVDEDQPNVVREVYFRDPGIDYFDLEKAAPSLKSTDPTGLQPQYKFELTVRATDTNYETGPKVGTNLEPIRMLVISEADLLAEMSKDEENLIGRLEDSIKRLKQAQTKLNEVADRLSGPTASPDLLLAMAVRGQDIAQDLTKSLDQTAGTLTEYKRLYRECEVNRINESVLNRYREKVIGPLDDVMNKAFPKSVESHAQVAAALAETRKPDPAQIETDRADLAVLILQMQTIRDGIGELLNLQKLRDEMTNIINRQRQIRRFLQAIMEYERTKLFIPEIRPAEVTLAKKGKAKVKHTIDWKVFDKDSLTIRLSAPAGSGLKVPDSLDVKNADRDDFEYEVEAGDVAGEFAVTLTPAVGLPVKLKVTVK